MATLRLRSDQPFHLSHTLSCGQVFRWEEREGWWWGVVGKCVIRIRQEGDSLTFFGAPRTWVCQYFHLDADLPAILSTFRSDPSLQQAIEACKGLRIVRQPAWECTLSYLLATNSNIPMIRRRIGLLARELGEPVEKNGTTFYTFPYREAFSDACESAVERCRLGYRTSYLLQTACRIAGEAGWEERIGALPFEEARTELMNYRGIGPKAADCILLFGFQRYEAFPVDVWIRRILEQHYPWLTEKKGYEHLRKQAQQYFGPYAGYAQEYLFSARKALQVPRSQLSR